LALTGRRGALFDRSGMEAVLRREFAATRLEELAVPVAVMATNAVTGQPVLLQEGFVFEAVMASSAMPGMFPPVPACSISVAAPN
jgi:NTE family protein